MFLKFLIIYYVIKNELVFKINKVIYGKNLRVRGPMKLKINQNATLSVGDNFVLTSGLMINPLGKNLKSFIQIDKNAKISIGHNVGMSCVTLWAKQEITIGNNVKLGADVSVIDSDMHSLNYELRRCNKSDAINAKTKKIKIGDDVFIGMRSIICKGVDIGACSIIGAGSVVVSNVPEDEIWAGNPAKFIKQIPK